LEPLLIWQYHLEELRKSLDKMARGKCADRNGLMLEMFLHAGATLQSRLLSTYNEMLASGSFPDNWQDSLFVLLPKPDDLSDPSNWRPIAILEVTYKIFARLLYDRLRNNLDVRQSGEQFGFRRGRSTSDALMIMECMISKSIEWNLPLWIISVDMKKAFDRVEHRALFEALARQGIGSSYINVLRRLYDDQKGMKGANAYFPIERGVRQGDVLSAVLFNSVMEEAVAYWKRGLRQHGFALDPNSLKQRLTNIRYADDLLLFAKSLPEALEMLELLVTSFGKCGLELNSSKTKILTTAKTDQAEDCPLMVECMDGFVEVLRGGATHKYLGRKFPGDLHTRAQVALDSRLQMPWSKYAQLKPSLTNRHVNLRLRLRLFDTVVSPTVLYGLETTH
jgi:sorting nexin-29